MTGDMQESPAQAPLVGLRDELSTEIRLMLRFAWSRGLPLPEEVCTRLDALEDDARSAAPSGNIDTSIAALAALHADLTRAISPALPVTLCLMENHASVPAWLGFMGPISNVRRLQAASFAFLLLFVAMSLSPDLTVDAINEDIYRMDGMQQLVVMAFLLSAAGIGGTFQALFTAQRYVADSSYDPRHDGSYWILIGLGLVSGLLLSVLLPIEMESASSPSMTKPLLALLGGFSSGLVYRILQRLVDTIDSLFQPRQAA